VRKREHAAALAQPVAFLEDIGQRVEIMAEMLGQLERAVEFREERRAILGMGEVGDREFEMGVRRRRLQRVCGAGPRMDAGVVEDGKIGRLHSRILLNER
jgi:hypothetical protein